MDPTGHVFLDFSVRKLRQLAGRIEDCLGRLTDEQIWRRGAEAENAVGNLVLHLSGNVRQWIVSAIGGAADIRRRDDEFAARGDWNAGTLAGTLKTTVEEAAGVLETLSPERVTGRIRVQNFDLSILEAVYHVVEHFSYHTGQIIFATKLFTGSDLGYYRDLTKPAHADPTP